MKRILPFFLTFAFQIFAQTADSLTLSEIMFCQPESNAEFVEIYNYSESTQVNLLGLKIKYEDRRTDSTQIIFGDTLLLPRSFAVILEGDYDFENGCYEFPDTVTLLKILDNAFGSSGMSNSNDKTLRLISSSGDTLSIYTYTADNVTGHSDEKIILNENNSSGNWDNSNIFGGTPGIRNSVTPFDYDLCAISLIVQNDFITVADTFRVISRVANVGLNTISNAFLDFYVDINRDTLFTENEFIGQTEISSLASHDTTEIFRNINISDTGNFAILSAIHFAEDENDVNDSAVTFVNILPRQPIFGEICINEIKYKPMPGEPEWLEIFNNSDSTNFNLREWRITDSVSSKMITEENFVINSHEFVILSSDDAITDFYEINSRIIYVALPSLNNSGDKLKLFDAYGNVQDSVEYSETWNNSGNFSSLEKIRSDGTSNDSTNWKGSCNPNTATPGEINCVSPKKFDIAVEKINFSDEHTLINSNVSISATVKNLGSENAYFDLLLYYDENGDSLAETLVAEIPTLLTAHDSAEIDLIDNVLLDCDKLFEVVANYEYDQDLSNNEKARRIYPSYPRRSIIVNEVLFNPQDGECEWVELMNNSSLTINLKNWTIEDLFNNPTEKLISKRNYRLSPDCKLVIARDSSFLDFHSEEPENFILLDLPNLNNTSDGIVLKDGNASIIDSLLYFGRWLEINKRSLERIFATGETNDSTNWSSSVDAEFSTPGRKNSVTPYARDLSVHAITIDTARINTEFIPISVNIVNCGLQTSSSSNLIFYDDLNGDGSGSEDEEIGEISVEEIAPFDSLFAEFLLPNPQIGYSLLAEIVFMEDERQENNSAFIKILPHYPNATVKINEIHYAPSNGEPEWIEFFNCSNKEINIENFNVSDLFTEPRPSVVSDSLVIIAANSYFVLAKDSSIYDYHDEIPSPVIVKSFANLNNDTDGIILQDSYGTTLDSVTFNSNWGGVNGCSLERIRLNLPATDSANWSSSIDAELSTPGRINSVSPKIHDFSVDSIYYTPTFPNQNETVHLFAAISNNGTQTENNVKITLSENNAVTDSVYISLNSAETAVIEFQTTNIIDDSLLLSVTCKLDRDEFMQNNSLEITVYSGINQGELLITEFMSVPDSSGEWIEIFNASQRKIDLNMLVAEDSASYGINGRFINERTFIYPKEYFVLCSDTTLFDAAYGNNLKRTFVNFGSLSNLRDIIYLSDFRGNLIDSLFYDNWKHIRGVSFEKKEIYESNEKENWAISIDSLGATPCKENSISESRNYNKRDVIINEIMFEPAQTNAEFVEIYNRSDFPLQIGGWKIYDSSGNETFLCRYKYTIAPGGYFVVASDSSIFYNYQLSPSDIYITNDDLSLGNEKDAVVIRDLSGKTIDSVYYFSSWHNNNIINTNNRSLERINPESESNDIYNWTSSLAPDKATPTAANSVFQNKGKRISDLDISPNPFSPDNDGFEDFCFIRYILNDDVNFVRIRIYDAKGRLMRTLADNYPSGAEGEIIFDGRDEDGKSLPLGIYVLLFEQLSDKRTVKKIIKPLVIARKLH